MTELIQFKYRRLIQGLDIDCTNAKEYKISEHDFRVKIKKLTDEEFSFSERYKNQIQIEVSIKPPRKVREILLAISKEFHPTDSSKAKSAEDFVLRENAQAYFPNYPDSYIQFINSLSKKLNFIASRFFNVLVWRHGLHGNLPSLINSSLYFSNSEISKWVDAPVSTSGTVFSGGRPTLKLNDDDSVFDGLIENKLTRPLGHDLLIEAISLIGKSRRSSLIVAVTAMEVAVKTIIINKSPSTNWLLENVQLPPITKVLKEYLPSLFEFKDEFYPLDDKTGFLLEVKKIINKRNSIIHTGDTAPNSHRLEEMLIVVEKVIWICDYCAGYKWADLHIRKDSGLQGITGISF